MCSRTLKLALHGDPAFQIALGPALTYHRLLWSASVCSYWTPMQLPELVSLYNTVSQSRSQDIECYNLTWRSTRDPFCECTCPSGGMDGRQCLQLHGLTMWMNRLTCSSAVLPWLNSCSRIPSRDGKGHWRSASSSLLDRMPHKAQTGLTLRPS